MPNGALQRTEISLRSITANELGLERGAPSPDNSPNGPEKAALFGINRFAKTF